MSGRLSGCPAVCFSVVQLEKGQTNMAEFSHFHYDTDGHCRYAA